MTDMEHYKKRLIHQHEKPGSLPSPYTTTEEEDDSLQESPLSPASSVQSRDSGSRDRKRDEGGPKVARKRAVCRSQFRHQSMELFKLGSSIPTSLCKTKEPYNVCTGKNLQMCYQNGGSKKGDKPPIPTKGSQLTESILNTMDGGKKKETPLWRSLSVNSDSSVQMGNTGRHILPAIVPELPDRRRGRVKSLPENNNQEKNKNCGETSSKNVYEFTENNETVAKVAEPKKVVAQEQPHQPRQQTEQPQTEIETEKSPPPESDLPINLSMKNRSNAPERRPSLGINASKKNELNSNQFLTHAIPKQPSNVPKKPPTLQDVQNFIENETQNSQRTDENCVFVTAIPGNALDPQKQSNVIVINFPHMQQQMSRMGKEPAPPQQSPMEMLDAAIMSLVDIVKSSVESVFNIMSLPVLNRLYIDLSRYLPLPAVSVKMKVFIEEALNALIAYLLANLFRLPRTPKARDFVHKLLQLDLRPHMDFLVTSLDVIRQKVKYDYFMDHLLKVLSRNPQGDAHAYGPVFAEFPQGFPGVPPFFPNRNPQIHPEVVPSYTSNPYWRETLALQRQLGGMNPLDVLNGVTQAQARNRGHSQGRDADLNLMGTPMRPENFNRGNVAMIRPDLYLADNRCVPPNAAHVYPEQFFPNTPSQPRTPKGRPRSARTNKTPPKSTESSSVAVFLPEMAEERAIFRERQFPDQDGRGRENAANRMGRNTEDTAPTAQVIRRNNNVEAMAQNVPFGSRSGLREERHALNGTVTPHRPVEDGRRIHNLFNGGTMEQIPHQSVENHQIRHDTNVENTRNTNSVRNYFPNNPIFTSMPIVTSRTVDLNRGRLIDKIAPNGNTVIRDKEVPQHRNEDNQTKNHGNAKNVPVVMQNTQNRTSDVRDTVVKQSAISDVEQFLQTNIIVGKSQTRGSVLENMTLQKPAGDKTCDNLNLSEAVAISSEPINPTSDLKPIVPAEVPKTVESNTESVENQNDHQETVENGEVSEVVSGTVIIEDKSMEISKSEVCDSVNEESSVVRNGVMDVDDVVLERVSPNMDVRNGISFSEMKEQSEDVIKDVSESDHGRTLLEADVSIEKVTDESDLPPKLIRLATLKRKLTERAIAQKKKMKWAEIQREDIVVIDDDEKTEGINKSNYKDIASVNEKVESTTEITSIQENARDETVRANSKPIIEDISSEEEVLEPFQLYSTYENKVRDDPRRIFRTMEVSHCKLIEADVETIKDANRHLFEKPPVYTRPVTPRTLPKPPPEEETIESLAEAVRFEEDEGILTCSLKVKNNTELKYPSSMDVRRFSPTELIHLSPVVQKSPAIQTSPMTVTSPVIPSMVRKSPVIPVSPVHHTPTRSAVVQMSPRPGVVQTSPMVPVLDESGVNWRHWFSEEEKRGMFNFERSQSLESSTLSHTCSIERQNSVGSDYCPNRSPDDAYREVKIDSKVYKVKNSVYENIPKGKLCYIRESNTFVRYFDDNQMELFLSNLNMNDGNGVPNDLLKQVKGRVESHDDVETFGDTSRKGEVISLSKDVVFSTEDHLSDPELYVEEVMKVQRYVPKDFYGFYKYVTGYQIVNHHTPISFQTFLTMHNTNGIRLLFKNYVNTLIEGKKML